MKIETRDLVRLCPNSAIGILKGFEEHAPRLLPIYGMTTSLRWCHFIAQIAHESAGLSRTTENLNYSAAGLRKTFPKYFDRATAEAYARQPARIANRAYANRLGNGPEASGDGWRYRGRGLVQLSGKFNYNRTGERMGVDLVADPDSVADMPFALQTALIFWRDNSVNSWADDDDVEGVTKRINGGTNGIADRRRLLAEAKKIWPVGDGWATVPALAPKVSKQESGEAPGFFTRLFGGFR